MALPPETSPLLDDVGRKLLAELQSNARASFADLARKSGLSPSAAAERLRRMEDAGVIRGYRADIDPEALGLGVTAMIRMTADGPHYRPLLTFLDGCDQVRECHHVTGGDALMLKVQVSSIADLEGLIMKLLHYGVPTTSLVLSTPVQRNTFDLFPGK
jgi:Lrp/AsnC family leucine-responsive transcriptional regulator